MFGRHFPEHRIDIIGFEDFKRSKQVAPIENILTVDRKMIAFKHKTPQQLL